MPSPPPRHLHRPRHLARFPATRSRPGVLVVSALLLVCLAMLGATDKGQPQLATPAQAAPSPAPSAGGLPVSSPTAAGGGAPAAPSSGGSPRSGGSTLVPASRPELGAPTTVQVLNVAAVTRQAVQDGRSILEPSTTAPETTGGLQGPPTPTTGPPTTTLPDPTTTVPPTTGPNHEPGCDPQPDKGQDDEHGHPQCEAPAEAGAGGVSAQMSWRT